MAPVTAAHASQALVTRLQSMSNVALPFIVGTYSEALAQSNRTESPLLVYLHSDLHVDGPTFVRSLLLTTDLASVVDSLRILVWAGSAHDPDGFEAAQRFGITGYPYAALFAPAASQSRGGPPQFERHWSCSGLTEPSMFVEGIRAAAGRYRGVRDMARAQQLAREQERQLQVEQEQAYEAAVARDLERARAAAAKAREEQEAARLKEAEEAKRQEEEELKAAIDLSKSLDKEGTIEACRKRVAGSPEPGPGQGVATLRLQLPSGTKLQRRFNATDELRLVRDFVVVTSADMRAGPVLGAEAAFDLACAFPKRTFDTHSGTSQDLGLTLQAAGLAPQAVLLVTMVAGSGS